MRLGNTGYGDRGRAEKTPASQDLILLGGLAGGVIAAVGLLVGAAIADRAVLTGRSAPLRGHPFPSLAAGIVAHPGRPLAGFGYHGGPASAWLYWSTVAVMAAVAGSLGGWLWGRVPRWGNKTHDGFASASTLRRRLSIQAARAKAAQTRPDLAGQGRRGFRGRRGLRGRPDSDFGYQLGRAVTAGRAPMAASWESSMLVIGPSGCGKTNRLLVPMLLDHPGPAIVTSTKVDIFEATAPRRGGDGRPVWVLDPEDMAPAGQQVRWSVVRGCEDTRTAERRAAALIAGAPGGQTPDTGNSAFFKASALSVLKAFLHAAALDERTIVDVTRWCRGDFGEAQAILAGQGDRLVDAARMLTQHTMGAAETTSGVMRYVENTLACFSHRPVIDACTPNRADEFNMGAFLADGGTVYLLGKGSIVSSTSALTTAFCEELLYVAGDEVAPTRPGRRLAPPLLACLDEVTSVAPIPSLPLQLADARGRGIVVVVAAQSPSQLRSKWSDDETETMFNASAIATVFGGLSVDRDLRWMSDLAGQRYVADHTSSFGGMDWRSQYSTKWDQVPVLRPDEIRTLGDGHALILAGATPPVISDLPLIFDTPAGGQVTADMAAMAASNDRARRARRRRRPGQADRLEASAP
jgi:type IV secretory pathway TraG/TraD family ATPase VirD4